MYYDVLFIVITWNNSVIELFSHFTITQLLIVYQPATIRPAQPNWTHLHHFNSFPLNIHLDFVVPPRRRDNVPSTKSKISSSSFEPTSFSQQASSLRKLRSGDRSETRSGRLVWSSTCSPIPLAFHTIILKRVAPKKTIFMGRRYTCKPPFI